MRVQRELGQDGLGIGQSLAGVKTGGGGGRADGDKGAAAALGRPDGGGAGEAQALDPAAREVQAAMRRAAAEGLPSVVRVQP